MSQQKMFKPNSFIAKCNYIQMLVQFLRGLVFIWILNYAARAVNRQPGYRPGDSLSISPINKSETPPHTRPEV